VKAEHVDGETPLKEREEIMARVTSGETQVLCNVFVASYGLDIPRLEVAVLARPTRNITLYLQTIGRVLRTFPGKESAMIIDHSGAVSQHGFADDYIPWSLDGKDVRAEKEKKQQEKSEPKEITCGDCGTVFKGQRQCPNCGNELIPRTQEIPVHEAQLKEIKKNNRDYTGEDKAAFFGGLKYWAREKGYNRHWASHKYRAKFSVWPNKYKNAPIIPPSPEVLGFIQHQQIKYAKRKVA